MSFSQYFKFKYYRKHTNSREKDFTLPKDESTGIKYLPL